MRIKNIISVCINVYTHTETRIYEKLINAHPNRRVAIVCLNKGHGVSAEGKTNKGETSERHSDSQVPSQLLSHVDDMRSILRIQEYKHPFSSFHEPVPSCLFSLLPFFLLCSLCLPFRLMPVALDRAPQSPDNKPQGGAASTYPFNHVL